MVCSIKLAFSRVCWNESMNITYVCIRYMHVQYHSYGFQNYFTSLDFCVSSKLMFKIKNVNDLVTARSDRLLKDGFLTCLFLLTIHDMSREVAFVRTFDVLEYIAYIV